MTLFKKYISNLFFILFLKIFSRIQTPENIILTDVKNILLVNHGDLQNALLTTPLLVVLNKFFHLKLTVLCSNKNSDVFINNSFVSETIVIEENLTEVIKLAIRLRKRRFNIILDTNEKMKKYYSFIIGLINTNHKIGFIKKDSALFTHRHHIPDLNKHHASDRVLSLTDFFEKSYTKTEININYQTTDASKKTIENYLIKHDLNYGFKVLVNISGKREHGYWGVDNYKKLIKYLSNYNLKIIILASIDDIEIAEKISNNKHLIFYNTDFDIYSELLRNSSFIFSPDSYTVQLAAAFKIPVFCLFVQHKIKEMVNVPYNSDFDFVLTDKPFLSDISFGRVLNSFVPYLDYVYERYKT